MNQSSSQRQLRNPNFQTPDPVSYQAQRLKNLSIETKEEAKQDDLSLFGKNSPSGRQSGINFFGNSAVQLTPQSTKVGQNQGQSPPKVSQAQNTKKQLSKATSVYHFPTQQSQLGQKGRPRIQRSIRQSQRKSAVDIRVKDPPQTGLNTMVTNVRSSIALTSGSSDHMSENEIKSRSELIYKEHLFQTFQAIKFIRTLPQVDSSQLRSKRLNLPKRPGFENKKTIIFDLDETLVHCCENTTTSNPDVILPIRFPTGEIIKAGINVRPYAIECLREANNDFEVIVFTASHKCYADVVLDYLDPTRELIHHRLYRDNCLMVQGIFVKDLRIFANRRIQDIVIVDNAAYSFGFQIDNGIPIISWHDDRHDRELYNLMDYIKVLAAAEDIREINRQTFHLRTFYEDYIQEFMINDQRVGQYAAPATPQSSRRLYS